MVDYILLNKKVLVKIHIMHHQIKESVNLRAKCIAGFMGESNIKLEEIPKKTGHYSKDHFEVFFDTKVY